MTRLTQAWPIRPWLLAVGVLVTAWHAPGPLSVDSVIALHEATTGEAFGWMPTFQSALLAWLGGGEIASALHVALMVAVTVFSLDFLLGKLEEKNFGVRVIATVIALNPLIWLMLGIVWRDVLLGVAVLDGATALLVLSGVKKPERPWIAW